MEILQRESQTKRVGESLKKRIVYFGRYSGIHGLGHLFRKGASSVERLFWVLVLLASSWCLYQFLAPIVELSSEVSFTPDTRYLPWTTTFPAVTVCEAYSPRTVQKKVTKAYRMDSIIWGKDYHVLPNEALSVANLTQHMEFDMKRFLTDILYARGSYNPELCVPCGGLVPCDLPWREMVEEIRFSCESMLSECKYNGEEFKCCENFHLVDSEYGPCYAFNTLQTENYENEKLRSVNRSTGPGVLSFRLSAEAQISVHSNEELATNNLNEKFVFEAHLKLRSEEVTFLFSVVEIVNDPMLEAEEISTRRCRYLHEVPNDRFHTYKVYSYGACRLAHSTEHDFEHCRCIHPARDLSYKDNYCNFTGISCLVSHSRYGQDVDFSANEANDDCLPSCVESELSTIHIYRRHLYEKTSLVKIQMTALPTLRYERNLLRNNLDLVVSIGGIVGLFFSASILSLAEIFYLLLRKPSESSDF